MSADTDSHDRAASKRQYDKLLRIVAYNTGDPQRAMARRSSIIGTATDSAGMDAATAQSKLNAAKENGDLAQWHDRVFLTDPDSVAAVSAEARDLLGTCNRLLQEARDDD